MGQKKGLDKETFLHIAKASGLDTHDPHMEELYAYLQNVWPILKSIETFDLGDAEPVMPLFSERESSDE